MALIVQSKIDKSELNPPDTAPVCVSVNPRYLSRTYYELEIGSKVLGVVLEVRVETEKVGDVEGMNIELIYGGQPFYDLLFFTTNCWSKLREFGVTVGALITLRLEKAIINEREIYLYPKRDVKWSIVGELKSI